MPTTTKTSLSPLSTSLTHIGMQYLRETLLYEILEIIGGADVQRPTRLLYTPSPGPPTINHESGDGSCVVCAHRNPSKLAPNSNSSPPSLSEVPVTSLYQTILPFLTSATLPSSVASRSATFLTVNGFSPSSPQPHFPPLSLRGVQPSSRSTSTDQSKHPADGLRRLLAQEECSKCQPLHQAPTRHSRFGLPSPCFWRARPVFVEEITERRVGALVPLWFARALGWKVASKRRNEVDRESEGSDVDKRSRL
ncbi:hypothetical protein C8R41DRAFT_917391 [Lentinula lateritia]|uniref:Uncharacterized protein n=1 Tax=Lentinula lateritia TaxID=40482 RepID=A0ABQ8VMR8_9AGAR|nr:hypothetical protein C8R41DRAFT_917391 [Lentinula lateritia]